MVMGVVPSISGDASREALLLSRASYSDEAHTRALAAPRWTPVDPVQLGIQLSAGESFSDGLFTSGNGVAFVATGELGGERTLAIAFRGSDDKQDWITNLRDIDRHYENFESLIQALDRLVATEEFDQVVVTGHSLGGAMAQKFMSTHADGGSGLLSYTFGAPGIGAPTGAEDGRVVNYRIADDPVPFLSDNREEIGAMVASLPRLGKLTVATILANAIPVSPSLTPDEVYDSFPYITRDYAFVGRTIWLEGPETADLPDRVDAPEDLLRLDFNRHSIPEYADLLPAFVAGTDDADLLAGTGKVDEIFGLDGDDILTALDANDLVYGNVGADVVYGNRGDDTLFGGQDRDTLFGGQGHDRLTGNRGDDTLIGGKGADAFVCRGAFGADTIADFNVREGDRIVADAGAMPTVTITAQGVALDFGEGNMATLTGVPSFDPAWMAVA